MWEIALRPEGDAFFPVIDAALWREHSREAHTTADGVRYAFVQIGRAHV